MVHSRLGNIEFYQRGDLYLANFRAYVTDRALNGMTTQEQEALFDKTTVKRAQEAGVFVRNAGYPSEQVEINLVRSRNINNVPFDVQDVKKFFEIYGTPVAAFRGRPPRIRVSLVETIMIQGSVSRLRSKSRLVTLCTWLEESFWFP